MTSTSSPSVSRQSTAPAPATAQTSTSPTPSHPPGTSGNNRLVKELPGGSSNNQSLLANLRHTRKWIRGPEGQVLSQYVDLFSDAHSISVKRSQEVIRKARAHFAWVFPWDAPRDFTPKLPLAKWDDKMLDPPPELSEEDTKRRAAILQIQGMVSRCMKGNMIRCLLFSSVFLVGLGTVLVASINLTFVGRTVKRIPFKYSPCSWPTLVKSPRRQ
jgi:hypothetical protein